MIMPRYMNAEKYNLDRIYFGGCFIRGKWEQRKWITGTERCDRTRGYNLNAVICYTILEQRDEASIVPSARGVLVSRLSDIL